MSLAAFLAENQKRTGLKTRPLFLTALMLLTLISGVPGVWAQVSADDEAVVQEVERLRALKQENPQAYQQYVQEKKEKVKSRVEKLKQSEPRYQAFMEKERGFKKERLERLQNKKPEAYQRFMAGRAERLEKMAEKNPERFNQIKNNRPRVQEWHEKRKMNRPGREGFQETHPSVNRDNSTEAKQFRPRRADQIEGRGQNDPGPRLRESNQVPNERFEQGRGVRQEFQERENFPKNQIQRQPFQNRPEDRQFQNREQQGPRIAPLAHRNQSPEGGMQKPKFQGQGGSHSGQPAGGPGQKRDRGGRNSPR